MPKPEIELKPCPFCGGTNLYAYRNLVECRDPECGGSGPDVGDTQLLDAAKDAWNTRPAAPEADGLWSWDIDGTLMFKGRRAEFKHTRIGTLHYGEGTRQELQMGAPYMSEDEAKSAIMVAAREWLNLS